MKKSEVLYAVQVDLRHEAGTIKPHWVVHEEVLEFSNGENEQRLAIFTSREKAVACQCWLEHKSRIVEIKVSKI